MTKSEDEIEKSEGEGVRIGVYVCHCGVNIAGTVDVRKVVELSLIHI